MDIATKTVTTKVHTAKVEVEDLKTVALSAVKRQVGIVDDASIVSSTVDIDADGSLKVEIVEAVPDAAPAGPDVAPTVPPGIVIPTA